MSTQFTPLAGCLQDATERRTAYAESVCHLFNSTLTPNISTPLSAFTAAETVFAGYTPQTFTAFFAPLLAPVDGYMITSPLVQFAFDSGSGSTTDIANGVYMVDASGNLRQVIIFTDSIPLQQDGQGVDVVIVILFGTNQTTGP